MMRLSNFMLLLVAAIFAGQPVFSQSKAKNQNPDVSKVWVADNGNGTYTNPIIYADYSDPDVCRVGDDFYMTASSFNAIPGLPLLHSKDLVNWTLVGHALTKLVPTDFFKVPQHGCGVWAPCIRHYGGEFYIFYPDPDFGIYMIKSKHFEGPWSEPILIKAGKGIIDPAPLWDDNGKAYLGYAYAGSRAGIKSILVVCSMSPDATFTYDDEVMVFDGHLEHETVEGPKFYKRNGYYYIFAPAGGVTHGWQLVLRSKNVFGPYEEKTVMAKGSTEINGPHQGAWVSTPTGEDWFIHFQDQFAYGRVVHLNPMKWVNDWPIIGIDKNGDGTGEPVTTHRKPNVGQTYAVATPPDSDEFNGHRYGLQWQWHANKHVTWGFPSGNLGYMRLNCIPKPDGFVNLWQVPNLFMQKFPSNEFKATTKVTFYPHFDNEELAFVVMGRSYSYISLKQVDGKLTLYQAICKDADQLKPEKHVAIGSVDTNTLYFRLEVTKDSKCQFSYSTDGKKFLKAGEPFEARQGRWIGAKMGFAALREGVINNAGYADVDWFRVEK